MSAVALFDRVDLGDLRRESVLLTRAERRRAHDRGARRDTIVNALPTAGLLVAFDVAVLVPMFLAARVYALVFLLVVPGVLLLAAGRVLHPNGMVRLALAVAASMLLLMGVAVGASVALPAVGVAEPLARGPLVLAVNYLVVGLTLRVARREEPLGAFVGGRLPRPHDVVVVGALALVPATGAAGAMVVNNGGGSAPAIAALVAAGGVLVAALVVADRVPEWLLGAALYAVAVAVVYSYSLRGDRLFGWDIQEEFRAFSATMQAGAWHPPTNGDPYRAMLSITALPAMLARITGVSGLSLFRVVDPLIFALFPVLVYAIAAQWLPRIAAFAAAALVVVQLPFSQQLPAITRQEIALVFFGALVVVAFDADLPLRTRRIGVILAGAGLAVTHYSTAYVTALALVGTCVACALVRLVRGRVRLRPACAWWVVLAVVGVVVGWNAGITRSTGNVTNFVEQASERGPEFLANAKQRSLLSRWLVGNAPERISASDYARRTAVIFREGAPWLVGYPPVATDPFPPRDKTAPSVAGPLPMVCRVDSTLLVVVSQAYLALTVIGVLVFAWRRRRNSWSTAPELAMLGVVLLGFVAAMRVSGVAAEAYNQERAQIHVAAVLSVGFAAVCAAALRRRHTLTLVALGGALVVVFLASSGLAIWMGGGAAPANLVNAGEAYERFAVSDSEVATARWLATNRAPGSLVYTDRYGKLRIWNATAVGDGTLIDVLTPQTLDRHAYVYASEANVRGGRARGAIGQDYAVYAFPRAFLDSQKAAIYSTGSTLVYR